MKNIKIHKVPRLGLGGIDQGINSSNKDIKNLLFHAVNYGETLDSISKQYNLTSSELKRLNGLKENKIYIGQVLKLKDKTIVNQFENLNKEREKKIEKLTGKKILNKDDLNYSEYKPIEDEKYPYEYSTLRENYIMDFGFTTNLKLDDGLIHCLNGIGWINHHICFENYTRDDIKKHFLYINVFYLNKLGEVISGKQILLNYETQAQKIPNADAYSYEVKLLTSVQKTIYHYLSSGKDLHNEIFNERKYKFATGEVYDIPENNQFFKLLQNASIINRTTDTNIIYSIVQKKNDEIEKILNIISVLAIPLTIPTKAAKAIQGFLEIIAYAIDLDGAFGFSDIWFDTRGPIALSPMYYTKYRKVAYVNGSYGPQAQEGKTEVSEDNFLLEEVFEVLQNELLKNKENEQ